MFCKNCGVQIDDDSRFCPNCGTATGSSKEVPVKAQKTEKVKAAAKKNVEIPLEAAHGLIRGKDGVYRWVYELNMLKNPTIFITVWKIFFFIITGIMLIIFLIDLFDGVGRVGDRLLGTLKMYGIFVGGMTVLVALAMLVYAAFMGINYCVLFEMDEKSINHKQMPRQAKKAEILSAITVLAGLASGNMTTMGVGMTARTEMKTDFRVVRKVKAYRRRHLIKVNGLLEHNQVYADDEIFDFVLEYIKSHCENLK